MCGRLFQRRLPATGNARSPTAKSYVHHDCYITQLEPFYLCTNDGTLAASHLQPKHFTVNLLYTENSLRWRLYTQDDAQEKLASCIYRYICSFQTALRPHTPKKDDQLESRAHFWPY